MRKQFIKYWTKTNCSVQLIAALIIGAMSCALRADVSFQKDVTPIFTASCVACHSPEKKKGGLDLTNFKGFAAGGKEGLAFVAGQPVKSKIIEMISGDKPEMPEKGDKLTAAQIEIITKWIKEGAKDDSPVTVLTPVGEGEPGPKPLEKPPVYSALPVITALAYSADGSVLAVSGFHEVLLHSPDGSGLVSRLVGGAPRIESLTFSNDSGKYLIVSGGAPALSGNIQVWDVAARKLIKNYKIGKDTLFGVSISPDNEKIAFGCSDKTARIITLKTGGEILKLDQHSDWCLGTLFTVDGKRILSGSRDQAMKLSDVALGQLVDDINNPLEPVLCMSRHPRQDIVAYGGGLGSARIYKISDNQGRTSERRDTNLIRQSERQPGPVYSIAYSPDGGRVAVGSIGEVRIYSAKDGARLAVLSGHEGAIFAVAFSADGKQVSTGGYDGMVRIFDAGKGTLIKAFAPVPLEKTQQAAR